MQATAHIGFILAAYSAGVVVIVALIAWVMLDYRLQRRILAELETKGVARRSARENFHSGAANTAKPLAG
jgi:heme exporter protein D